MFRKSGFIIVMSVGLLLGSITAGAGAAALSLNDKASLQATMQQYIDHNLVDGAYLHLDFDAESVSELYPTSTHPMILQMGPYYVLCSDFVNKDGDHFNVDFYVARRGEGFLVFRAEVENREALARMMKAGKVKRVS